MRTVRDSTRFARPTTSDGLVFYATSAVELSVGLTSQRWSENIMSIILLAHFVLRYLVLRTATTSTMGMSIAITIIQPSTRNVAMAVRPPSLNNSSRFFAMDRTNIGILNAI